MEREHLPASEDLNDLADLFGRHFFLRRDIHARQMDNGSYICIHKPLRPDHLVKHLAGEITLGAYILDQNSRASFVVFDADDDKFFDRLVHTAQMLTVDKTSSYLEASRRGGHLWLFFREPLPGKLARDFGRGVLAVHRVEGVELYPKQEKLKDGPGSLIRAPFGVHRLTKQRFVS